MLVATTGAFAQTVSVSKVEPPNWWAGLPENPMLLVYGAGFDGAKVSTSYPGVTVAKMEPGNEGYLFIWLKMSPSVKPGTARFVLSGKHGRAEFQFPILKRQCDRKNRTQGPSTSPRTTRGSAQDDKSSCHVGLAKSDVMYLIMPDRFANGDPSNDDPAEAKGYYDRTKPRGFHGGDLKGVEEHLPYLKDLGVTALWLTPFWKNANDYHGYGVIDMYAVDPHFGSLRDYQRLVSAAHASGIKFFFDYVPNHTGPDHVWTKHPPLTTWLHGTPQDHPPFDYHFEYLVDPHATPKDQKDILEGWFAGVLPDLNVDDPHVAKYLLDNAVWWMETGDLDGFRLDTFPYSSRKFWSYWHRELFRIYPRTNTIGEVNNTDPTIDAFFEGGRKQWDGIDDGLSTMFDFPVESAIRDVLVRNKPADTLRKVMRYDDLYLRPDELVTFVGNHDTKRFMGEEGATPEKLKAAFGLLMTLRGIPQLYAGDEIGMPGGDDPDNRRDFPGGWKGDPVDAFQDPTLSPTAGDKGRARENSPTLSPKEGDKGRARENGPTLSPKEGDKGRARENGPTLSPKEGDKGRARENSPTLSPKEGDKGRARTAEQQDIFGYLQGLITLRKEHAALQNGHQWTIGAAEKYFAYLRDDGKEKVFVVFNKGTEPIKLELKDTPMEAAKALQPIMGASAATVSDGTLTIAAPKYGVGIYQVK